MTFKNILLVSLVVSGAMSSCHKKTDPIDVNNATVTLKNEGGKFVTDNITVNPKDSINFSFTITTNRPIKYVGIQKNPVNQTAFVTRDTITAANTTSYSAIKRLRADSINGDYIYRIVAHDSAGIYIGHKDIQVSVKSDYDFFTYRFLRVPDTVAKTNTCYMSARTGKVYSYSDGAAASGDIDFGLYYDTTGTLTPVTTDDLKFCLYALSAPQPQLSFYDISTWTKNATVMKKATSPAYNTLTSGGALRSAGVTNLSSGTTNKVTNVAANELIYFRTVTGKVGCMQVAFVNNAGPAKESYINVDVKIER